MEDDNYILETQWAEPVSLTFHFVLRKLYTEPSIVLPTKLLFIWPSGFRKEDFLEIKNCLWWPCLLTDRDEMSKLYRGHSLDASYGAKIFGVFRVKNHDFTPNKSYFFQF
jgi:hypothetical protein